MIPTRSKIQDQYAIESDSVYRFLDTHLELSDLLLEAAEQIRADFPQASRRLEAYVDPETGHEQLIAYVGTNLDFDDFMNSLEQFRQDWWLDNPGRAQSNLSIIPEY